MYNERATVISNQVVMPNAHLIWLEAPPLSAKASPGQFVMVDCGEESFLRRPLSIHRTEGGKIALLFNIVGQGTEHLARLKEGDAVGIIGPLGNGFALDKKAKNILLVAGGMGIAPLTFLADEVAKQGKDVKLLIGARNSAYLLPDRFLPSGIEIIHTTEDGSAGFQGLVTTSWANMHLQYEGFDEIRDIYACGPMPMYESISKLSSIQDKPIQISLEVRMGCGVGICYGCTIKTRQGLRKVCKDGPVFNLGDIIWQES